MMPKLCECGCGKPAPTAKVSNRKWGHTKGQPVRFIRGHHARNSHPLIGDADLAWLAGLLEGEGSFFRRKHHRKPKTRPAWIQEHAHVQVAMKDEDVIARVATLLGASYWKVKKGKCWMYQTSTTGYNAEVIMRLIRSNMGTRRQWQIDKALGGNT